jgi:hypothetical protein
MWKINESGRSSAREEMQKEFDELVDDLRDICLGNTEILRWGNLNVYREADAGGGRENCSIWGIREGNRG